MTLITNEIQVLNGFYGTVLVFAADRRITKPDGSYETRKKLFEIPYLRGGVSDFGLAILLRGGKKEYMSDWLRMFIMHHSGLRTLRDFAFELRDYLHVVIPADVLSRTPSGFHICGYNSQGFPEFWYLSNIGGMQNFAYTNLKPRYDDPREDFLNRDAKVLGWDGTNPGSVENKGWVYRNGDGRGHVVAFQTLDEVLLNMVTFPDFKKPHNAEDLANWVRFKLTFVARFYKEYGKKQIIGTPTDAFSLTNKVP